MVLSFVFNNMCSSLPTMILLLAVVASRVVAFNVDVTSNVVHSGPRGACDQDCMFGFSVAQHREKGTPW